VSPRTQVERREATTAALLDAGRELFAKDGFAATSLDAVGARAGVTKGALYHHYAARPSCSARCSRGSRPSSGSTSPASSPRKRDPCEGVQAGCRAFLERALDPELQRIMLIDGPGALGFATVREAEAPTRALLAEGLRRAMDAGRLQQRPVAPLAAILFGALCEAALTVARAEDQRAMVRELRRLFDVLT
jgi:Tetracyclin repressor-like, C-terminal domain/Bacterial regulatory proteins, tetR family